MSAATRSAQAGAHMTASPVGDPDLDPETMPEAEQGPGAAVT